MLGVIEVTSFKAYILDEIMKISNNDASPEAKAKLVGEFYSCANILDDFIRLQEARTSFDFGESKARF